MKLLDFSLDPETIIEQELFPDEHILLSIHLSTAHKEKPEQFKTPNTT